MGRTLMRSGKVTMEDGSAPPQKVVVESLCKGAPVPVAMTDLKGWFVLGHGLESNADASQGGPPAGGGRSGGSSGVAVGCVLRARLAGYRSSSLEVMDTDSTNLGAIVLSRPAGITGDLYSATSKDAPKPAAKAFEKAKAALDKEKWDQARPELEKAVEIYPGYAEAWFELGRVCQASKDLAQARSAYERSIKADAKFVRPYVELSEVLYEQHQWQATVDLTTALFKLDPYSFVDPYVLNAVSNMRLGNAEAAEASAREAVKLDTNHADPRAEFVLGAVLDGRGKSAEAAAHLRAYIQLDPNSPTAEIAKKRLAALDQAAGAKPAAPQPHPQ
jgi:tetratricopeptide (TPR) repeat protein